jgi:hypothetical protein
MDDKKDSMENNCRTYMKLSGLRGSIGIILVSNPRKFEIVRYSNIQDCSSTL